MNRNMPAVLLMLLLIVFNVHAKDYDALLIWPEPEVLAFPVTGVVVELSVQAGQQVKKGDSLAQLDLEPFQIQIKKARARLDRIKPLLVDAQRDFEQAQELFERTVLSEVELQKVESILKGLKADKDDAEAELKMASWKLGRAQLKAPFEGRVIDLKLRRGDVVSEETQSQYSIIMVPLNLMQAAFSVNADSAGQYRPGQEARVEVASGRYPAIVKSIVPDGDGQYQIRLEFKTSGDSQYMAGQKAKAIF